MAGHFERGIDAAGEGFGEDFDRVFVFGIDDDIGTDGFAHFDPVGADFGGEDLVRAQSFADGDGEESDGAKAGYEDVFAFDGAIHDGVDGIAESIEHAGDFFGDDGGYGAGVHGGDDRVGGESAVYIDAEDGGGVVDVAESVLVVVGVRVDDVGFGGDKISDFTVSDVVGYFDDGAAEFVADDAGGFDAAGAPFVPVVDVEVGSAERCAFDF